MKWLGQHIIDIVARFRSLIYLEGVENLGSASNKLLALDSDNKVVFRTKAETADDLSVIKSLKFILNNPNEQPAVNSGDATFSLTGSNGISTQLAGGATSINIIAVPGQIDHDSLFGYDANQHIDWTAASAGTIHASNYSVGFTAGDGLTLTGSDLDLDASLTTVSSILNASLKIGRDADNLIDFATTDDQLIFRVAGADELRLTGNELRPNSNNGLSLGSQYRMWSDLFLADGSVINFNDGDVTLTHAANSLTMAGGAMTFSDGIADSGTISAGTWQGNVIASAYLSSDTPGETEVLVINDGDAVWGHGEKIHIQVRNDEGSTIPAGAPLYSKGEIGVSNRIYVGVCDANDSAKMPCIGIAHSEMNTTDTKDNFAVVSGVYNTNISGFTSLAVGDNLYTQDNGSLSQTKPTGEASLIQNVAIVLRTNGSICQGMLVSAIGRTNDVPNLNSGYIFYGNGSNQAVSTQLSTLLPPDLTVDGAGTIHVNNVPTLNQNTTGNAATATALTVGNKTIDGKLTIGANQAGHDFELHGATTNFSKCMWDASHNQLHFSDQAKIVFGTGGGPGGSDSSIQANGSNLVISNTAGDILIGDSVEITGNLDVTGVVRPGITSIKILHSDFIADDVGRPAQIDDATSNKRFLKSHNTAKLYASVDIPLGFKATAVDIFGSGTSSMSVHVMDITSESFSTIGNGSIGTTFNFSGTPVNGSQTAYLLIELAQTSTERVFGGAVTITKI